MSFQNEPIAIIGSGYRFPGGTNTPSKLWDLLREPRDLLVDIPDSRFNSEAFYHPNPDHHGTTNVKASYFLSEDPQHFDAQFFGIPPKESESIDPQQRMLLETVYESICAAGLTIEGLRGSSTAVYVGLMCDDWSGILRRDLDTFPTYTATGMARSIVSNRISYFFDWHGPSMTIDSACSSSLVAVHQAIQTLRSGESRVALATGVNLILSPDMYIAESKLHMLSPSGRCRMWDAAADGYGRAEAVASMVLKTLSAALEDGDHIESIIRQTGISQDGRTTGITMPSNLAQTALIKRTYLTAGLDLSNRYDRPQFFQAHGTGTPVGDPQEAEAIKNAFFSDGMIHDKLFVGSIKSIVGHTESVAGLASLISASLSVQHGIVTPNMHFNTLSEKVAPFYANLEIPTKAMPWPPLLGGQPRRISVNSFGFGGTNVHAIIESYEGSQKVYPSPKLEEDAPLFIPLVFSAASEIALLNTLQSYAQFLDDNVDLRLQDLAWTLQSRRSVLPFKTFIVGATRRKLSTNIIARLAKIKENGNSLGVRSNVTSPRILGVLTGQGAQWSNMCGKLIESSAEVRRIIVELDHSLSTLPEEHRPSWSIKDKLLADTEDSDISKASFAQPLCTAVQIVLVELLRAVGIEFQAVVGHSSGEIGAAYAAGFLSAHDAIRIAYYRGFYANLAGSISGKKGSMMAVGTSLEYAHEFCNLLDFKGRLVVAAINSLSSITLSGDEDAIDEAIKIFNDEQNFTRKLKVDTAYHSFHMKPCSGPYLESIKCCETRESNSRTSWFSSVHPGEKMSACKITGSYWMDNMTSPVMFADAISSAILDQGTFDLVLEIGPHPALKGPTLSNLEYSSGISGTPYSGLLSRGKNDVESFSEALGFLWSYLGPSVVDFESYDKLVSGINEPKSLAVNLPTYPWDHGKSYWIESRISGAYRMRKDRTHPLLGSRCIESDTPQEIHWRNLLRPTEVPWLNGHKLQRQTVFPASGYIVMAVEAMRILAGKREVKLIQVRNLTITRAITFDSDDSGIETLFSFNIQSSNPDDAKPMTAEFRCYSCAQHEKSMSINAKGQIIFHLGDSNDSSLALVPSKRYNMREVDIERFYSSLLKLGYNYSEPFRAISEIRRTIDFATGSLTIAPVNQWEDDLLVHPGMLDSAFHTIFAAFCSPGDNRLWSLHVPTSIDLISINPYFCTQGKPAVLPFQSAVTSNLTFSLEADVEVLSEDGLNTFIEIESVRLVPFSRPSPENDSTLFSQFVWSVSSTNGELAAQKEKASGYDMILAADLERVCFYYLRLLHETITEHEKSQTLRHYQRLLDWAAHVLKLVGDGEHPSVLPEYKSDTYDQIIKIIDRYPDRVDVRLIYAVGQNLPRCIRTGDNILTFMTQDGLLSNFYEEGLGLPTSNRWIGQMAKQIAHRYPHMNILEIGSGTGGATRAILKELGSAFSSYTFTDISSAFFETAEEEFQEFTGRMIFKTFDMEKDVISQGYTEEYYDMIVASYVLHATEPIERALGNARRLLRPGGFLLVLEVKDSSSLRNGLSMGGLPGWWIGADSGRKWGPAVSLLQWDILLRKSGFSGIDTTTPEGDALQSFSIFSSQAVDSRINLLRQPISHLSALLEMSFDILVIIGGNSLETSRIVDEIKTLTSPIYKLIIHLQSYEALDTNHIPTGSTVLCLADLDEPIFKFFNGAKLQYIKTIFNEAKDMLWITRGCRSEEPYSNMMVGLGRALRLEYPNINLQMLDVDKLDDNIPEVFTTCLLRLQTISSLKKDNLVDDLLWSTEPEIAREGGIHTIPRLLPNSPLNDRYNSSRRHITQDLDPQKSNITIVGTELGYDLKDLSKRQDWEEPGKDDSITIRVSQSLMRPIKVKSVGSLFLCLGNEVATGESVVALSTARRSLVQVPTEWVIKCPVVPDPSELLLSMASSLLAQYLVSKTTPDRVLLIHEPFDFLIPAVTQQAKLKNIKLQMITSRKGNADLNFIYIHSQSPLRVLNSTLPKEASLFVDLSPEEPKGLGSRIAEWYADRASFMGQLAVLPKESSTKPDCSLTHVEDVLRAAWHFSKNFKGKLSSLSTSKILQPNEVTLHDKHSDPTIIVDWTSGQSVRVSIQPVDSGDLFRHNRTYWLVGLTGDMGQSLCQWMVCHGARYVVLTSRNPQIEKEWTESFVALGAVIKVFSMDVTNRDSVHAVFNKINETLPPIFGVANGAMILRDMMFQNMDFDSMSIVLKPKVDGSKYLNELFPKNTLDFFILFSSITAVLGNPGQSNYVAANMYMASLALQRKRRGLAGSVIDISSVIGVGYVERSEAFDAEYFNRIGYTNISEQDLHQLFAEAIFAGRPNSSESHELITGFAPVFADTEVHPSHSQDLKFSHFIIERPGEQQNADQQASVPLKAQLAQAKTKNQVSDILKESLIRRLKKILQISAEEEFAENISLEEQGVDSLVAVEVRSWFLKEIDIDMPVLKVLSGASVADLIEDAVQRLPSDLTPKATEA